MMTSAHALLPLLVLGAALGLAGCGKKEASDAQATSAARLLPRSITDDMPPYDTVRSKAAPADPAATGEAGESGADAPSPARSDAVDAAPAAPAASDGDSPPATPAAE